MTMSDPNLSRKVSWGELVGLGLLGGAVLLLVLSGRQSSIMAVTPGTPLPTLMAEGWLNSDGPLAESDLAGKVVLIDCWFTTCPPCRAAMPDLARLYEKYRPLGVEFVGLTFEPASELSSIAGFVRSIAGFDWPVGYGASPTLDMLGVTGFPTLIVFGPDGTAVWSGTKTNHLPDILDQTLSNADFGMRNE